MVIVKTTAYDLLQFIPIKPVSPHAQWKGIFFPQNFRPGVTTFIISSQNQVFTWLPGICKNSATLTTECSQMILNHSESNDALTFYFFKNDFKTLLIFNSRYQRFSYNYEQIISHQ